MEQNVSQGMCVFDQSLLQLYATNLITKDTAITQSDLPNDMTLKIKQFEMGHTNRASDTIQNIDTSLLSFSD